MVIVHVLHAVAIAVDNRNTRPGHDTRTTRLERGWCKHGDHAFGRAQEIPLGVGQPFLRNLRIGIGRPIFIGNLLHQRIGAATAKPDLLIGRPLLAARRRGLKLDTAPLAIHQHGELAAHFQFQGARNNPALPEQADTAVVG